MGKSIKRPNLSGEGYGYLGRFRNAGVLKAGHNPGAGRGRRKRVVREPMVPQGPAMAPGRMLDRTPGAIAPGRVLNATASLARALTGARRRIRRTLRRRPAVW